MVTRSAFSEVYTGSSSERVGAEDLTTFEGSSVGVDTPANGTSSIATGVEGVDDGFFHVNRGNLYVSKETNLVIGIRRAKKEDIEAVIRVWRDVCVEGDQGNPEMEQQRLRDFSKKGGLIMAPNELEIRDWIENPDNIFLVAEKIKGIQDGAKLEIGEMVGWYVVSRGAKNFEDKLYFPRDSEKWDAWLGTYRESVESMNRLVSALEAELQGSKDVQAVLKKVKELHGSIDAFFKSWLRSSRTAGSIVSLVKHKDLEGNDLRKKGIMTLLKLDMSSRLLAERIDYMLVEIYELLGFKDKSSRAFDELNAQNAPSLALHKLLMGARKVGEIDQPPIDLKNLKVIVKSEAFIVHLAEAVARLARAAEKKYKIRVNTGYADEPSGDNPALEANY